LIRQLRAEKGWTQQQLADICNLSLRTIQRVELHGIASLETSKALAVAFDVDRQKLQQTTFSPEPPPATQGVPIWLPVVTFIAGIITSLFILLLFDR